MKTSRLASPANPSGAMHRRVLASACPRRKSLSDLLLNRWFRRSPRLPFFIACSAHGIAVNLGWNPNPETDIASYQVNYGTSPGSHPSSSPQARAPHHRHRTPGGNDVLFRGESHQCVGSGKRPIRRDFLSGTAGPPPPPSIPLISKVGWTLKYASSEETADEDGRAINAFDGNPNTYWISRWLTNPAAPPHILQIDLGAARSIQGFRYLPRQDGYDIGNIGQYEFLLSMDGVNWGSPVAAGTFTNSRTEKEVLFASQTGRYIQLRALTDLNGGAFNGGALCCVAELNLLQGEDIPVPVNQAPVAAAQSVGTLENIALPMTLSASDPDGNALTYQIMTGPSKGTLSGSPPNLTYTPAPGVSGTDSFTFRANDGALDSNTATVSIMVTRVNVVPVALAKSVTTAEDSQTSIVLSATDADNDPLSFSIVSGPAKGSLTGSAPNLIYTPNADFNGADSFTFRVSDGSAMSNTATVSITVTRVNDAPVAVSKSAVTAEKTPVGIVLAASDKDGDSLSYVIVSGPSKGSLSGNAPNLTYSPAGAYNGPDSFTYRATDGNANSNTATVSITVTPVNDPPVAVSTTAETAEDTPVSIVLSAGDPDGDPLSYTILTNPAKGILTGSAPNLTYVPNANSNGADSFTFRVKDGSLNSNIATVSIAVSPVNDAPVAVSSSAGTAGGTAIPIVLDASDKDGDSLEFVIVDAPANGMLSGTKPNVTYTPDAGFNGTDSFTFQAKDGAAVSNTATVTITVEANPPPPPPNISPSFAANPIAMSVSEDSALAGQLEASDPDEGGALVFAKISGPAWLTVSPAGLLGGTPSNQDVGINAFTVQVADSWGASASASLVVTVINTNDAPVFIVNPITCRRVRRTWLTWGKPSPKPPPTRTPETASPIPRSRVRNGWQSPPMAPCPALLPLAARA